MRRSTALFTVGLLLAASSGISSAQTGQAPAPPAAVGAEKQPGKGSEKPEAARVGSRNALGTVKSATADTLVVAGKSKGKATEWTFTLDANTKIKKGSKDATAAELKEGDGVQVRYRTEGGKNIAAMVLARTERAPEAKPADKPAEKKQ